jgi:peptide/nickel transport system ATP-binding protein
MGSADPFLEIRGLKTYFFLREGTVRAVDGVDLTVGRGKTLGVVGESGCGKSVTAQSILQIVPKPGRIVEGEILAYPDSGHSCVPHLGHVVRIADLDPMSEKMDMIRGSLISMIFQEPMSCFSPVYTVGNQVSEAVLLRQKVSAKAAQEMAVEMFQHVGIPNAAQNFSSYPHQLSGGMLQRAMIAMALMCRPSLLIADEPTTALDVTTEAQILRLMRSLQSELGMAIMFVTHDLGVIAEMADEVVVMYLGKVVESAGVDEIFNRPMHPYLRALLRSIPRIGVKTGRRLQSIRGVVPSSFAVPPGCPFHPRCEDFMPGICDEAIPASRSLGTDGHTVACHLYTTDTDSARRGEDWHGNRG